MSRTICGILLLCLPLAGCYATQQARGVKPAGFLGNVEQLRKGEDGEARLIYVNPATDFSRYTKLMIEPVTIWTAPGSKLEGESAAELQILADELEAALRRRLSRGYLLIERNEPRALRLRTAITEAESANVALDIVSTVAPPTRILSAAKKLATGTHLFVGRAGIEAELVDAVTGERVMAAIDRRAGGKTFEGATSEWADVEQAFDDWSRRLEARLKELRERGAR